MGPKGYHVTLAALVVTTTPDTDAVIDGFAPHDFADARRLVVISTQAEAMRPR
jgi:hypothetical protein